MTPQDAPLQSRLPASSSGLPARQGGRQSRHLIQLLISCVSLRNRKRQLIFIASLGMSTCDFHTWVGNCLLGTRLKLA